MKKQIALALGVSFMSLPAFATKARLQALGEDVNGSQFISDNRNVFLNSATLNYHKDLVTMEWGDTSEATDGSSSPRAEGGFFKSSGNMAYGLYLGSESNISNGLRALAQANVNEQNNIDLFFAGDAGVQWGANLTYTSSKDETDATEPEQSAMRTRLGVISGDTSAFANIGLTNKAETTTKEFEGKGSYQIGVSHNMGDVTYMAQVQSITAEDQDGDEFTSQKTWLGAAKSYKVNDMANVWISGWIKQDNYTCDFAGCAGGTSPYPNGDTVDTYIPVTVAAEVNVKEWLTLRGSVSQNLHGEREEDDGDVKTIADTTVVNAGASLMFGDFQIDGVIGNATTCENNDADGDSINESVLCSTNTNSEQGILNSDNVMSRVSMTYRF